MRSLEFALCGLKGRLPNGGRQWGNSGLRKGFWRGSMSWVLSGGGGMRPEFQPQPGLFSRPGRRGRRAVLGNWIGRKERKGHREGWGALQVPGSGRERRHLAAGEKEGGWKPPVPSDPVLFRSPSAAFFAVPDGNLPDEPIWAAFGGKNTEKRSKIAENVPQIRFSGDFEARGASSGRGSPGRAEFNDPDRFHLCRSYSLLS